MCILLKKRQRARVQGIGLSESSHHFKFWHVNVLLVCTIFRKESNIFRLDAGFQRELPEFLLQVVAEVRAATCQTPRRE